MLTKLPCRTRGRQVEISLVPGSKETKTTFDLLDFYRRELTLRGVNSLFTTAEEAANILQSLAAGFEEGSLLPPTTITTYTPEQFAEAYEAASKGGKVVLTFV